MELVLYYVASSLAMRPPLKLTARRARPRAWTGPAVHDARGRARRAGTWTAAARVPQSPHEDVYVEIKHRSSSRIMVCSARALLVSSLLGGCLRPVAADHELLVSQKVPAISTFYGKSITHPPTPLHPTPPPASLHSRNPPTTTRPLHLPPLQKPSTTPDTSPPRKHGSVAKVAVSSLLGGCLRYFLLHCAL